MEGKRKKNKESKGESTLKREAARGGKTKALIIEAVWVDTFGYLDT